MEHIITSALQIRLFGSDHVCFGIVSYQLFLAEHAISATRGLSIETVKTRDQYCDRKNVFVKVICLA